MNSKNARPIVVAALKRVLDREPTLAEVYAVQAVARFDGGYGNFSSPPHGPDGPTSNNWGAVQDTKNFSRYVKWTGITNPDRTSPEVKALRSKPGPASPKPDEFFYAIDFQPGKGWFYGPYKAYPDAVDGAAHVASLLKRMGVLKVANEEPGWVNIARRMREAKYFLGYSNRTYEQNIRDYAKNLKAGGDYFEKVFDEKSPIAWEAAASPLAPGADSGGFSSSEESPPALTDFPRVLEVARNGNRDENWVKRAQVDLRELGLYPGDIDGDPGPMTMTALARVGLDALK